MTSGQPKRKRGVVLTPTGRQKLQEAVKAWEEEDNLGEKLTIEELSAHTKLDAGTVSKVLDCKEGVDRRTLERFFRAFNLALSEKDYRKSVPSVDEELTRETRIDWGEAVDVSVFYGRTLELETLEQWVVSDRCRLVTLLGIGGIGKTSLATKLGEKAQNEFDCMVWRSLREAPPLEEILISLIQFLSNQKETAVSLPESLGGRITKLLEHLRNCRCLIILDNAESILQEGQAGVYREGYEGYAELLRRVGESSHQSCLLVTSREKPRELAAMEGEALPVRSLQIRGVDSANGQEILKAKGLPLFESSDQANELIERCAGNPLALKLVATTIQDLFNSDIAEFLNQETIAFEGVRDLLNQHFNRLSALEKSVMYWLAIDRELVSIQELQEDIVPSVTKPRLLEALKGLAGRSLIEMTEACYTQQAVVMEYVTEQLIEKICEEVQAKKLIFFNDYALIKATSKDYVRESQNRLILKPVLKTLMLSFGSRIKFESSLKETINDLKNLSPLQPGYTCGNIINLLCCLKDSLDNCDFSNLHIRQAYLRGINLHNSDFSHSDLSQSVFTQTFGSIFSVASSPSGEFLAVGDTVGEIRLLRSADVQELYTLKGHASVIRSLAFSPDNQFIVSGSVDHSIKLWNVNTGKCIRTLRHSDSVRAVIFSPDGRTLITGSSDRTVKFWDIKTYECLCTLDAHDDRVRSIAINKHGKTLATASSDGTIKLWDFESKQLLKTLKGHSGWVMSVAFLADGQTIVTGGYDHTIRIWNTGTGQLLKTLDSHTQQVRIVTCHPGGQIIASSSEDHTIRLWDINTGRCLKTFQEHTKRVDGITFHSNGKFLLSGSEDHTVKIWNIETGQCLKTLQGYTNWVTALSMHPNGQALASNGEDHTVRLWNIDMGSTLAILRGHTHWVTSIAFSPDGQLLASSSADRTARVWKLQDKEYLHILDVIEHTDRLSCVAFSPDSQILITSSYDSTIKFWNIDTGNCILTIEEHSNGVTSVAVSSDGHTIVSSDSDCAVKLWDITTGKNLGSLQGHSNVVRVVTFNHTNQVVASGSSDHTIRLWNVMTRECVRTLEGHTNSVTSLCFSATGQLLISGSKDQTIKLWDAITGQLLKTFEGHSSTVRAVIFRPDGTSFASSSDDGTIKIWDITVAECIRTLRTPKPYEGMNITGVVGLTAEQKKSLIALGAIELQ